MTSWLLIPLEQDYFLQPVLAGYASCEITKTVMFLLSVSWVSGVSNGLLLKCAWSIKDSQSTLPSFQCVKGGCPNGSFPRWRFEVRAGIIISVKIVHPRNKKKVTQLKWSFILQITPISMIIWQRLWHLQQVRPVGSETCHPAPFLSHFLVTTFDAELLAGVVGSAWRDNTLSFHAQSLGDGCGVYDSLKLDVHLLTLTSVVWKPLHEYI